LRAGQALFAQGRPVLAVYPLRQGSVRMEFESPLGWRQVTGFAQGGDLIGIEPHASPSHGASAIALEDTLNCVIPAETLRGYQHDATLQDALLSLLRRNHERERILLVAIGSMKAAQRLAMLLLDLHTEDQRRGGDGTLTLAMTRHDMASLLGLTLETVSRLLSRFAAAGLITVRQRRLRIVDTQGLKAVYADLEPVRIRTGTPARDDLCTADPAPGADNPAEPLPQAGAFAHVLPLARATR
jgi:CRP/FNR family transcriptional regulator